MRIVIVGSPDSNKTDLAKSLRQKFKLEELFPIGNPQDFETLDRFAMGDVADYRTELSLALLRQTEMERYDDAVFTGTVLDSYCYALARTVRFANNPATTDKTLMTWIRTAELLAMIVRDSFKADKVVFITQPLQEDDFLIHLEEAISATLEELEIEHVEITAGFDPDKIVEDMWNSPQSK